MSNKITSRSKELANRDYFDRHAEVYDDRATAQELARRIANAITNAYPFDDEKTVLLDFGCGTGLLSRELAPDCKRVVGVDLSERMVAQFNQRVHNQGIPPEEMQAICLELEGNDSELNGERFDIIVSSMAYHHLQSPENMTKSLAGHLKSTGYLFVADVKTIDGKTLDRHPGIVVHTEGFQEDRMRTMFQAAELREFSWEVVSSAKMDGVEVDIFLASGSKS